MIKISAVGILQEVETVEINAEKGHETQNVIIHQPQPRNEYDEVFGREQNYKMQVFRTQKFAGKIPTEKLQELKGKKVKFTANLEGFSWEEKKKGKEGEEKHGLSLKLITIDLADAGDKTTQNS